jgi:iron(III) transport system ATP-binding protein
MSGVEASGLTKAFGGHRVLDGLDLTVPEGSLTAVLGPSGSGKTTLLRILAGFEPADAGSVSIDDLVVDDGDGNRFVAPRLRRIGYVPQEGSLFPHLTVARNVAFGIRRGPDRAPRVAHLIDLVGLTGLDHRFPHQLSGGQQQRVALARALAVEPSLVLLDEPFTSLDAGLRSSVRADVKRILGETGTTALLVTHDQDEALSCADVVAVISEGRIAQRSTPRSIYARPLDAATAQFVGLANLIDGVCRGSEVATQFGVLALLPGSPPFSDPTPALVLVRPEQIRVDLRDGEAGSDGGTGAPGRVTDVQFYGHGIVMMVALDGASENDTIVVRTADDPAAVAGSSVRLSVVGAVHAWASERPPG